MSVFAPYPGAWIILLANLALSLFGLFGSRKFLQAQLFRPYWTLRGKRFAPIISSCFLHVNMTHLLLNMLTFYFFAFPVERMLGTCQFAGLYTTALLFGQLGTWFKQRGNPRYASLGASGAVSGVLLAFIVYFPTQDLYLFFVPVPIPAFVVALGFLGYSWYASGRESSLINHDAHLYGALSGLAYVAIVDSAAYENLRQVFA